MKPIQGGVAVASAASAAQGRIFGARARATGAGEANSSAQGGARGGSLQGVASSVAPRARHGSGGGPTLSTTCHPPTTTPLASSASRTSALATPRTRMQPDTHKLVALQRLPLQRQPKGTTKGSTTKGGTRPTASEAAPSHHVPGSTGSTDSARYSVWL